MTNRPPTPRGFTIVELLVAATLAGFAMAAVLSCFVFLARNFTRLTNHQMLQDETRRALAYLESDLALARSVKTGTAPTAETVTLVLPAGEVTYTYDPATFRLRRLATTGASPALELLGGARSRCTSFTFQYLTGSHGPTTSQFAAGTNIPYSVKQIVASFTLQTRAGEPAQTAQTQQVVSPRYNVRNRTAPDGN